MHQSACGSYVISSGAFYVRVFFVAVSLSFLLPLAMASDAGKLSEEKAHQAHSSKPIYSPYANRNFPSVPLFGDRHLHTSYSMDAGTSGTRLNARDAYRFAKGEQVTSNTGQPVKLSRPLDFLVVADHSDGFGFFPLLISGAPSIMADPQGKRWNKMLREGQGVAAAMEIIDAFGHGRIDSMPPLVPA